jgi:hypothetical protein
MKYYKEVYEHHEENDALHSVTTETTQAEKEFSELLNDITDAEQRDKLDTLIGKIARTYEMQGFLFAMNVCKSGAMA